MSTSLRQALLLLAILLSAVCRLTAETIPVGAAASGPVIRLGTKGTTVDVAGLRAQDVRALADLQGAAARQEVFALYVEKGGKRTGQPAVLGDWRMADGVLRFSPRFPLAPGVRYRAVLDLSRLPGHSGAGVIEEVVGLPKPKPAQATVVEHVYPSADTLPENQLKFYLHFSAPMSRGEAYEHVRLLDEKGKVIERAFLELEQELWDPVGKRFTLFIDPGRIKRGLKPREDLGPVLEAGRGYVLVIDTGWEDAQGNRLGKEYRKDFRAVTADETTPDPKTWKIQAPRAGTRTPLTVALGEPLDHALLHRLVWVRDAAGRKVAGAVAVTDREKTWSFTPAEPWAAGRYELTADTRLEDLAGNSIGRPFEVDVFHRVEREVKAETVGVPFRVAP
jgi:hypothetical protein